jgi:arylsulfatase A-like enzyme
MKRQLLTALCALVSSTLIAAERPNVLLIVADDLGWADVGWHGGFGRTPHMDRLVREGRELDRHYVHPVCTPTRAALMSGRCPGRFGPQALSWSNLRAMPLGTLTFASALKSVGYRTHLAGKWHLGARPEWLPNNYGFDTSYGTLTGAADPWTHKYLAGHPYEDTWHRDGTMSGAEGNATELVAAEALNRISHGGDQPWFVYVPFHAVHTPVDAPEQYKRIYDGVRFHDDPVKHESRLRMAAMVAQLDAKIGEFVAALERTGQRERTLIIFTSDNGGAESRRNGYVGTVPHSPYNSENAPLRGEKDSLYEGGIRVCAFANWPGRLSPGKVTAPLYVGDWLPTVAGLVGLKPATDPGWDGLDRWEVVSGANATPPPRTIYIAHPRGQALLYGDWKIIRTKGDAPQLFDLAQDPYEREDLAGGKPEKLGEMIGRLDTQLAKDDPHLAADLEGLPP